MENKGTILLLAVGEKSTSGYMPMPLLSIANFLLKGGFETKIIDTRVLTQDEVDRELNLEGVLYVAFGVKTGREISYAIELSKKIKSIKDVPIVWGGPHPSFLPEQTAENKYVDIVVRGEAEGTMLELAQRFSKNKPIDDVQGITFKNNGKIISNPTRPFLDINKFGNLPYHLLKLDKYPLKDFFVYETSRGCPHKCAFCYNLIYNTRSYREKKAEVVLNELEYIIKNFGSKTIFITDDNIFVNKKRVEDICNGVIEKNLKFQWGGFCRAEYFKNYDDEFLELLKKSGLTNFSIGGESGSDRILKTIDKDETVADLIFSAKKCSSAGIEAIYSFMWGFPEETEEDFQKTLKLIMELWNMKHIKINGLFMLNPYPGTPLYKICLEKGYPERKSLEEWIDFGWSDWAEAERLVWIDKDFKKKAIILAEIVRYVAHRNWLREVAHEKKIGKKYLLLNLWRLADMLLYPLFMYRMRKLNLKFPLDVKLWVYLKDRFIGSY